LRFIVGRFSGDHQWPVLGDHRGYVGKKEAHKGPEEAHTDTLGDAYTFVAIERNTKLVISWHLGRRTSKDTLEFTEKIRKATVSHFQITTDGFTPYRDAVEYSLGMRCDFAQLVKVYATPREGQQRYSPAEIVEAVPVPRIGNPDPALICTSHVDGKISRCECRFAGSRD
jgi:hypothetical protein